MVYTGEVEPCETQCALTPRGRLVILDRAPSILVVSCSDTFQNMAQGKGDGQGLDDISIQYRSPAQLESIQYRFCGVVLHKRQNHFIIRVAHNGEVIEYNGFSLGGQVRMCKGWQVGLLRSIRACLILHTCISMR